MDKKQALNIIDQALTRFTGTIAECNAVQQAFTVIAKEEEKVKEKEEK
jgi:hypothetical protein